MSRNPKLIYSVQFSSIQLNQLIFHSYEIGYLLLPIPILSLCLLFPATASHSTFFQGNGGQSCQVTHVEADLGKDHFNPDTAKEDLTLSHTRLGRRSRPHAGARADKKCSWHKFGPLQDASGQRQHKKTFT